MSWDMLSTNSWNQTPQRPLGTEPREGLAPRSGNFRARGCVRNKCRQFGCSLPREARAGNRRPEPRPDFLEAATRPERRRPAHAGVARRSRKHARGPGCVRCSATRQCAGACAGTRNAAEARIIRPRAGFARRVFEAGANMRRMTALAAAMAIAGSIGVSASMAGGRAGATVRPHYHVQIGWGFRRSHVDANKKIPPRLSRSLICRRGRPSGWHGPSARSTSGRAS